jgi:hypothetical protein
MYCIFKQYKGKGWFTCLLNALALKVFAFYTFGVAAGKAKMESLEVS